MLKEKDIQEALQEVLIRMEVTYESIDKEDDGIGIVRFNIVSKKDSRLLIGPQGEHLQALNTVIKKLVETKESPQESLSFIVDVNGYQKKLLEELRGQTRIIAERVKLFKKAMPLPAMSAYERMIVHAVAQTLEGVTTRSEGTGKDRYVVVVPEGEVTD